MQTLSSNKIKFINSLKLKKYRHEHKLFIVEGEKMIEELLLSDFEIETICATKEWMDYNYQFLQKRNINSYLVTTEALKKISTLETPNKVLAIAKYKEWDFFIKNYTHELIIALDNVQDPGNMGTIIRLAEWFGISTIICSAGCVDFYNPKVVQATMGSIFRLKLYNTDLPVFLSDVSTQNIPIYATSLDGMNIYQENLNPTGILIFGNESKGISEEVLKHVTRKLLIPSFNKGDRKAESLNIAVAAGIVCSEFKRRK